MINLGDLTFVGFVIFSIDTGIADMRIKSV